MDPNGRMALDPTASMAMMQNKFWSCGQLERDRFQFSACVIIDIIEGLLEAIV